MHVSNKVCMSFLTEPLKPSPSLHWLGSDVDHTLYNVTLYLLLSISMTTKLRSYIPAISLIFYQLYNVANCMHVIGLVIVSLNYMHAC